MSELQGLHADVLAPSRLGMSEMDYRVMILRIVAHLQSCDETVSAAQIEEDLEEAEWLVAVLHAAGYVPRAVTP